MAGVQGLWDPVASGFAGLRDSCPKGSCTEIHR